MTWFTVRRYMVTLSSASPPTAWEALPTLLALSLGSRVSSGTSPPLRRFRALAFLRVCVHGRRVSHISRRSRVMRVMLATGVTTCRETWCLMSSSVRNEASSGYCFCSCIAMSVAITSICITALFSCARACNAFVSVRDSEAWGTGGGGGHLDK